jgi:serine/threonine protein kinase
MTDEARVQGPEEGSHGEAAMGDIDGDGDLDILVASLPRLALYRNNLDNRAFLTVKLLGIRGPRESAGGWVRLYEAGGLGRAERLIGVRQVTMEEQLLHFGLGGHPSVDVEALFPGGSRLTLRNVARGRRLVLRETSRAGYLLRHIFLFLSARLVWLDGWVEALKLGVVLVILFIAWMLARPLGAHILVRKARFLVFFLLLYGVLDVALAERALWLSHLSPPGIAVVLLAAILAYDRTLTDKRASQYVAQYKILAKLGEGGMGVVYKAKNTITGDTVALKVINPALMQSEESRKRFIREAQIGSGLDHPNIIKIYEKGEARGTGYICMEYVAGRSLRRILQEEGPLEPAVAVSYAIYGCLALRAIHQRGIIHRDVKSDNLMLTREGEIKLMDFGLSKSLLYSALTTTGSVMGTLAYMAPEQALGKSVDGRVDIYSLGVVLYEVLTGELPLIADNQIAMIQALLHKEPRPPRELRPEIPEDLEAIVLKAVRKDRTERYQMASEMLDDLIHVVERIAPDFPKEAIYRDIPSLGAKREGAGGVERRESVQAEDAQFRATSTFYEAVEEPAITDSGSREKKGRTPALDFLDTSDIEIADDLLAGVDGDTVGFSKPLADSSSGKEKTKPLPPKSGIPFKENYFKLLKAFQQLLKENEALKEKLRELVAELEPGAEFLVREGDAFIGESPAILEVKAAIARLKEGDEPVLILGERATGKRLAAATLHREGPRKDGPFLWIDLSGTDEEEAERRVFGSIEVLPGASGEEETGLLEETEGGVLYLQEVFEGSPAFQARLCRFLKEGDYTRCGDSASRRADVRIVASSVKTPKQYRREDRLHDDLWNLFAPHCLSVPPLRDRKTDIPGLLDYYLKRKGRPELKLNREAMEILLKYSWPGNFGEFLSEIDRLIAISQEGETILPDLLSSEILRARR